MWRSHKAAELWLLRSGPQIELGEVISLESCRRLYSLSWLSDSSHGFLKPLTITSDASVWSPAGGWWWWAGPGSLQPPAAARSHMSKAAEVPPHGTLAHESLPSPVSTANQPTPAAATATTEAAASEDMLRQAEVAQPSRMKSWTYMRLGRELKGRLLAATAASPSPPPHPSGVDLDLLKNLLTYSALGSSKFHPSLDRTPMTEFLMPRMDLLRAAVDGLAALWQCGELAGGGGAAQGSRWPAAAGTTNDGIQAMPLELGDAELAWRVPELLAHLASIKAHQFGGAPPGLLPLVMDLIPLMTPWHMRRTLWALVRLGIAGRGEMQRGHGGSSSGPSDADRNSVCAAEAEEVFLAVGNRLCMLIMAGRGPSIGPSVSDVALVAWAFATAGHRHEPLFHLIAQMAISHSFELTRHDACNILFAYAAHHHAGRGALPAGTSNSISTSTSTSRDWIPGLEEQEEITGRASSYKDSSSRGRSRSVFPPEWKDYFAQPAPSLKALVDGVVAGLSGRLDKEFDGRDLAQLAWALGRLNFRNSTFMTELCDAAASKAGTLSGQDVATIMWAASRNSTVSCLPQESFLRLSARLCEPGVADSLLHSKVRRNGLPWLNPQRAIWALDALALAGMTVGRHPEVDQACMLLARLVAQNVGSLQPLQAAQLLVQCNQLGLAEAALVAPLLQMLAGSDSRSSSGGQGSLTVTTYVPPLHRERGSAGAAAGSVRERFLEGAASKAAPASSISSASSEWSPSRREETLVLSAVMLGKLLHAVVELSQAAGLPQAAVQPVARKLLAAATERMGRGAALAEDLSAAARAAARCGVDDERVWRVLRAAAPAVVGHTLTPKGVWTPRGLADALWAFGHAAGNCWAINPPAWAPNAASGASPGPITAQSAAQVPAAARAARVAVDAMLLGATPELLYGCRPEQLVKLMWGAAMLSPSPSLHAMLASEAAAVVLRGSNQGSSLEIDDRSTSDGSGSNSTSGSGSNSTSGGSGSNSTSGSSGGRGSNSNSGSGSRGSPAAVGDSSHGAEGTLDTGHFDSSSNSTGGADRRGVGGISFLSQLSGHQLTALLWSFTSTGHLHFPALFDCLAAQLMLLLPSGEESRQEGQGQGQRQEQKQLQQRFGDQLVVPVPFGGDMDTQWEQQQQVKQQWQLKTQQEQREQQLLGLPALSPADAGGRQDLGRCGGCESAWFDELPLPQPSRRTEAVVGLSDDDLAIVTWSYVCVLRVGGDHPLLARLEAELRRRREGRPAAAGRWSAEALEAATEMLRQGCDGSEGTSECPWAPDSRQLDNPGTVRNGWWMADR